MRTIAALLTCLTLLPSSALAGEHPWVKVTSPHFTVVSDSSEGSARKVAAKFEQIRWVLLKVVPGMTKDPNTPVLVVGVQDQEGLEKLTGPLHRRVGNYFMTGRDHNYVIIRMDQGDWLDHVVVSGYVRELVRANLGGLPAWLNDGISQFYAECDLSSERVKFGLPNARYVEMMRGRGLILLPRLFVLTNRSPEYTTDISPRMATAESWAIVHYLLLGDNGAHAQQLSEYISLLQHGKDSLSAAKQAFGDLDKFQDAVLHYMKQFTAPYRAADLPRDDFSKELSASTMSMAETNYWRASVVMLHDVPGAKALAEAASTADPKLAQAYEVLALISLKQGDYPQARAEFEQALKLDPRLYLSNYFHSELLLRDQGDASLAEAELRKAATSNPSYAPALLKLARLLAERPEATKEGLRFGWQAVQREETRVGYHLAFGYMLLKAGMAEQAELAAKHASEMYADSVEKSDTARLLALAQQCEAKHDCGPQMMLAPLTTIDPGPDEPLSEDDISVGVISEAKCSEEGWQIKFDTKDIRLDHASLRTTRIGTPDTFWVGPEYFNCVALKGETAMLAVKKGSEAKPVRLEVLEKY